MNIRVTLLDASKEERLDMLHWLSSHVSSQHLEIRHPHRLLVEQDDLDVRDVQVQSLRLTRSPHALFLPHLLSVLDTFLMKHRASELRVLKLDRLHLEELKLPQNFKSLIKSLDLSHNCISSLGQVLNQTSDESFDLSKLALNSNRLKSLEPINLLPKNLTVLLLADNHLRAMWGLERLVNLTVLDISFNVIDTFDSLVVVGTMSKLRQLDFRGNPIAVHPQHRQRVLGHLHAHVKRAFRPLLDGRIIVPKEKKSIGKFASLVVDVFKESNNKERDERDLHNPNQEEVHTEDFHMDTKSSNNKTDEDNVDHDGHNNQMTDDSSSKAVPLLDAQKHSKLSNERIGDDIVTASNEASEREIENCTSCNDETLGKVDGREKRVEIDHLSEGSRSESETTRTSNSTRRRREVNIAEPEEERGHTLQTSALLSPLKHQEYLATKERVSELVSVYGKDNWLHSESGAMMEAVLNIDTSNEQRWSTVATRIADARDKQKDIEKFVEQAANTFNHDHVNNKDDPINEQSLDSTTYEDDDEKQLYVTVNDDDVDEGLKTRLTETNFDVNVAEHYRESENKTPSNRSRRSSSFHSLYEKDLSDDSDNPYDALEGEGEPIVLDVLRCELLDTQSSFEDLRLKMTPNGYCSLETKATGQILDTWFTHRIEQCDSSVKDDEDESVQCNISVTLVISVPKKASTKRLLVVVDKESHVRLREQIDPVLKEHQEKALDMGAMQCVKCGMQFTFEKDPHKRHGRPVCPSCSSSMVVELEDTPTPSSSNTLTTSNLITSTPIKRKQVGRELQQVDELSSSLGSRRAAPPLTGLEEGELNKMRNSASSSDVSVISNPSQSSIEVLHQHQQQQVQRQPYVTAEVVTSAITPIDKDVVDVASKMMESSSSGSMTDSVSLATATATTRSGSTLTISKEENLSLTEALEALETSRERVLEASTSSFESGMQSPLSSSESQYVTCVSDTSADTTLEENSSKLANFLPVGLLSKVAAPLSTNVLKHFTPNVAEAQPAPKRDVNPNIFEWDEQSFRNVDHRLKLFCDLSLCTEVNETVLMAAKGEVYWHGSANAFTGIVMVSNSKIYVLRFVTSISSDPQECLHLLEAFPLRGVGEVSKLLGGQGVEMTLNTNVSVPGNVARLGLVLGDNQRMDRFIGQFEEVFTESVSNVTLTLKTRDESEERRKLAKHTGDTRSILAVIFARLKQDDSTRGLFVLASSLALYLIGNLLEWTLRQTLGQLNILHTLRIDDIANIEVSDAWPSRLEIRFFSRAPLQLLFESERSVDALLEALRHAFQVEEVGRHLESLLTFYLESEDTVLSMRALAPNDAAANDRQWVEVLKRRRFNRTSSLGQPSSV